MGTRASRTAGRGRREEFAAAVIASRRREHQQGLEVAARVAVAITTPPRPYCSSSACEPRPSLSAPACSIHSRAASITLRSSGGSGGLRRVRTSRPYCDGAGRFRCLRRVRCERRQHPAYSSAWSSAKRCAPSRSSGAASGGKRARSAAASTLHGLAAGRRARGHVRFWRRARRAQLLVLRLAERVRQARHTTGRVPELSATGTHRRAAAAAPRTRAPTS